MFIEDMLFSVISNDKAVVMFPDRLGFAYLFGKDIDFDPLSCPTWKVALRKIHALGIKPAAQLYEDPDSGEIGWVVLDTTLPTKQRTKLKKAVMGLTTLSLDPTKVDEDREKVSKMRYFVGKAKFQQLYVQAEEITQEKTPVKIENLFAGIKSELPLPDTLLAEFTVIREQQQKTQDLFDDIANQAQETLEVYDSMPLFDVLTVDELRDYCKQNNIHSVPTNAKKKEVFLTHLKKFYSALTV